MDLIINALLGLIGFCGVFIVVGFVYVLVSWIGKKIIKNIT